VADEGEGRRAVFPGEVTGEPFSDDDLEEELEKDGEGEESGDNVLSREVRNEELEAEADEDEEWDVTEDVFEVTSDGSGAEVENDLATATAGEEVGWRERAVAGKLVSELALTAAASTVVDSGRPGIEARRLAR